MMMGMRRLAHWLIAAGVAAASPVLADTPSGVAGNLAATVCAAIAARVDEVPGSGPVFLRSYDSSFGQGPTSELAMGNAAFTVCGEVALAAARRCCRPAC